MQTRNGLRPIRRLARACVAGAALLLSPWLLGCDDVSTEPREREVALGGLFSLTGNWSTLGKSGAAAMELAVDDVNQYLEGNAAHVRFVALIEDTRLEPAVALEKAQSLRARGVQFLIGPQSSAEVAHLKPFVDGGDMLLISPSSTAGSLAIANDNVYRFSPADSLEGVAVSVMMWEDGIRAIVPVWRDDQGNAGLEKSTRVHFGALGGSVLAGVKYGATATDFGPTTAALDDQVEQAIAQYGSDRVAVYLAAFDEVVGLFARAAANPVLGSVRWYGSDGVARSDALLGSPAGVQFAIRTRYPNPMFGLDPEAREIWEPLAARVRARTNLEPDAFAFAVYDAVWTVARGYIASGATRDMEQLKRAFTTAAAKSYGATGWLVLNDAGDRRYGDFDYWAIRMEGGVPRWTRVARYESGTGKLVR